MRSRKQLAEIIQMRRYGGAPTADAKISLRQIMIHIDQVRDRLAYMTLWENMKDGDAEVDPAFIQRYKDVVVSFDTALEVYYSDLPVKPMSLPHDKGIVAIRPPKSHEAEYVRVPKGWGALRPDLAYMEGKIGWEYIGGDTDNRVEYRNMTNMNAPESVLMEIVPSDESAKGDDPVRVPSYLEDEIVRQVLALLGMPSDQINDNEDTVAQNG